MAGPTTIEVTENVTTIAATGDQISIDLTDDVTSMLDVAAANGADNN